MELKRDFGPVGLVRLVFKDPERAQIDLETKRRMHGQGDPFKHDQKEEASGDKWSSLIREEIYY